MGLRLLFCSLLSMYGGSLLAQLEVDTLPFYVPHVVRSHADLCVTPFAADSLGVPGPFLRGEPTEDIGSGKRMDVLAEQIFYFNPRDAYDEDRFFSVPVASRFLFEPGQVVMDTEDEVIRGLGVRALNPIFQPFYFKRTEVTNWEYREFVEFVVDSLKRSILAKTWPEKFLTPEGTLNYETEIEYYYDTATANALKPIFYPEHPRFYRRREIDPRTLNYSCRLVDQQGKDSLANINVYPDTLTWVEDFPYSFNQPMSNMYFWHPAYDHHPVVGVTWHQATAYCRWLEAKLNRNRTSDVYLQVRLPRDYEWEWMSCLRPQDDEGRYGYAMMLADQNWYTDLAVGGRWQGYVEDGDTLRRVSMQSINNIKRDRVLGSYSMDGYFHTYRVNRKVKERHRRDAFDRREGDQWAVYGFDDDISAHRDVDGAFEVGGPGGNVSEWMDNTYAQWSVAFNKRQELLAVLPGKDMALERLTCEYWDEQVDHNGQLVRGGNWSDERYGYRLGHNYSGASAKTFVDRNRAHCNLGFRYVIVPVLKAVE